MDNGNQTLLKELILIGLSRNPQMCILLFITFLLMYILTILGNSFLIFIIIVSPKLHTPMYYFLCNLSFLDLSFTSCTIPKFLFDIFSRTRTISVAGCLTQMNFSLFLGQTECILLTVMAYDRYIAICFPLYYTTIMSWRTCRYITIIMWAGTLTLSNISTMIKPLFFCKGNQLNHFTCEILAVLEVACGDLTITKFLMFILTFFLIILPLAFIVGTYFCIVVSLLDIRSAQGRTKAFSTCASHLTVVIMFYGTSTTMYLGQARFSSDLKYFSLCYAIITPVLNPLIYSLRNNDVKEAFNKIWSKHSEM